MISRNPQSSNSVHKSPYNFLSKAKIKTFKSLDRKGSIFNLIKEAKTIKMAIEEMEDKKSEFSSKNSSNLDSNITVKQLKYNLNTEYNSNSYFRHRYKQSKIPILTTSNQILKEAELINSRDKYYKKNLFNYNNNFGRKKANHDIPYRSYDTKNEEEFIQLMGLNDEEKDPLKVIQGKRYGVDMKYEKSNFDENNIKFLLLKTAHQKVENKKIIPKSKKSRKMVDLNHIFMNYNEELENSKKNKQLFSFLKRDEFSDFLITNYIKEKYPKFLDDSNKFGNTISTSSNMNNNTKRKIFVIKNSSIIYNSKAIPGFLLEIPTVQEMNKYSANKRKLIMSQFYEFITKKFQTKYKLIYIFKKNRIIIPDFGYLSLNDKYIFVSHKSIFEGLLFPLNKNLIQTYIKHFKEKERDKYYFNESSFEEKNFSEKSENEENSDDIYDLFFKTRKKKPKIFQKKIKNKISRHKKNNLNSSFTFGLDENEKYEYVYYSDNEIRIKNFLESEYELFKNNNLNFYIQAQNQVYDTKIKSLFGQLSSNKYKKNSSLYKSFHKPKDELIKDYLIEKKMPVKNILKQSTPKKLTNQAIINSFNLLKTQDKTIDINKFIKTRKGSPLYLPYVEQNIKDNTNKYYDSRSKLDKEYPSALSFNFPKVVEKSHKYSLTDLIRYYTKFKSLLNLWLNMHPFAEVTEYGIDFDTFFSCTEDICDEEEIFVKKIFDKINNSTSGILSLEDYVDGLIALNRNVLTEQIEFFLKVFNSKEKTYFTYQEIFDISKLSIKRLIKIKSKFLVETISDDLGGYLAHFMFNICDSKPENGIEIKKLKDVLEHDKEHKEFLKLFMCFFGETHLGNKPIIDEKKFLKHYKEKVRISIEKNFLNLK